jgi:hypothetical protein
MESVEQLIQERWRDEQVPLVDGILHDDGTVFIFAYEVVHAGDERGIEVTVERRDHLARILEENPDLWTTVMELEAVDWEGGDLTIRCGDGAFGSDGFVAATRRSDDHVVWIVFSQKSNPFRKLTIQGESVVATTELGQVWRLQLPRPESVSVGWA